MFGHRDRASQRVEDPQQRLLIPRPEVELKGHVIARYVAKLTAIAATVLLSRVPARTPTANANSAPAANERPSKSNAVDPMRPSMASRGERHQVNSTVNALARTRTPRPTTASVTVSQRVRVTVWVKASFQVPCSSSRAISGAPISTPAKAGRMLSQVSRSPQLTYRSANAAMIWSQPPLVGARRDAGGHPVGPVGTVHREPADHKQRADRREQHEPAQQICTVLAKRDPQHRFSPARLVGTPRGRPGRWTRGRPGPAPPTPTGGLASADRQQGGHRFGSAGRCDQRPVCAR